MRKGVLITAYSLLIFVGVVLAYFALHGAFSTVGDVLLPIAYVGVILFLVQYQMRAFPSEQPRFSFRLSIRFRYLIKSLLCLVIAFLWTAIVSSMTSDTWIGNALAVGPGLMIVGAAAYFFYRSVPNPFRR
jgi:hypothetical protein